MTRPQTPEIAWLSDYPHAIQWAASVGAYLQRNLVTLFLFLAIIAGAIHAWADRNTMNSDGIAYLDMGESYLRGDWQTAVNACYSPLYSWLLGFAIILFRPSSFWEFPLAHLVNFAVYLAALGCFHFFLETLIGYNRTLSPGPGCEKTVALPDWAWYALGYTLFIWSSLTLITVRVVSPDMCVAAFVYLAAAIVLRKRMHPERWHLPVLLGMVLAFGYLAKTPMFPLAFLFIAVSGGSTFSLRRRLLKSFIALLVFLAGVSPFIIALSVSRNRLTIGDSGKYNYGIFINGIPPRHWQGNWPPDSGTPAHPTRMVFASPAVYEFGSPIKATYPVHYDPAYWTEGAKVRFDWGRLRTLLVSSAMIYSDLFFGSQGGLIVGFLILFIMGYKGCPTLKTLFQSSFLLVPACAALGMYAVAHIEPRYVAPFVVLVWAGIGSAVRLPDSTQARKLAAAVVCAMVVPMLSALAVSTAPKIYATARELRRGIDVTPHVQWQIAQGLREMGIQPKDKVAVIGLCTPMFLAHWARLARVRIVAEIPKGDMDDFLAAQESTRFQVMETFAKIGVRAIVAENLPRCITSSGWQRIGKTDHFVLLLGDQPGITGLER